jgi:uncharacterized protein (TIGR02271 family)
MTSDLSTRVQAQTAFDSTGKEIGDIQRVFADRETKEPTWISVRTGAFGSRESIVPLAGSQLGPEGLSLAVRKDVIAEAPAIDAGAELDMAVIDRLNRHYHLTRSEVRQPRTSYADETRPAELTTFEEQPHIGTEAVESGTVRLRKVVVTEPVETTVPLRHEEVRIERVPVGEAGATPGHRFAEESAEITLHAERPTIAKESVPVETVRLVAETHMDQKRVGDEVRRERIEIEDQKGGGARRG